MLRLCTAALFALSLLSRPALAASSDAPPEARLAKAQELHDAGQYDEAIALYREILEATPDDPVATAKLMLSLYAKGEQAEVVTIGEAFLGKGPVVPAEAYVALGSAYDALKDVDKAGATFREGISRHPTHARLHFNLGVNRMQAAKVDEAVPAFVEALKLEPRHTSGWLYLGKACQELRLPGYALLAYGRFLALEPTSPRSTRPAQAMTALLFGGASETKDKDGKSKVVLTVAGDGGVGSSQSVALGLSAGGRHGKKAAQKSDAEYFPEGLSSGLEMLGTIGLADKKEDPFWRSCAFAYFEEARKAKHLEAAAYEMRRSLGEPEVVQWIAAHGPAMKAFQKWSQARKDSGCRPPKK